MVGNAETATLNLSESRRKLNFSTMKTSFIKLIAVSLFFLIGSVNLTSCSKSNNSVQNDNSVINTENFKENLTKEDYQMRLIELNIEFWTRLSSQPLSELKKVCDANDVKGLIKLSKYSNEGLMNFMNKTIDFSKQINKNGTVKSDCGCTEEVNLDKIYEFVVKIKSNGGAGKFFQPFIQDSIQNFKTSGGGSDKLAQCLAACSMTCLPLGWDPPAWAACMAVCTAACYYIQN